jgi:ribulose-phosphate 3-epimerase
MGTSRDILIAPSILSADFTRLGEEIRAVQEAGADWIHIDVMDGHFVPNITIGPMIVEAVKRVAEVPLDVHLMISNPDCYLEDFHASGANILTVHPETTFHLHRTLTRIRELGMRAGVALNPSTGLGAIEYVMPELDVVMLTAPDLARNGADVFVAGSAVFGHPPYGEVIKKLKSSRPAGT